MRGHNTSVRIIITKETKLSLRGKVHKMLGTLLGPFSGLIIIEGTPHAPRPPPSPQLILFPYINNHWDTHQALFQGFVIEAPSPCPPTLFNPSFSTMSYDNTTVLNAVMAILSINISTRLAS